MSFGGLLFLFFLGSLCYGVYQFVRAREKTREAVQTTFYIVLYPVVVYFVFREGPTPAWLAAPVVVAGLPWLVAGIHLNEIVKDPTLVRRNEFVGFPHRFWIWGGILSAALGALLG
jgi:hypothetical protein